MQAISENQKAVERIRDAYFEALDGLAANTSRAGNDDINSETKFSMQDSDGNTLTEAQQEYFKNSKVRDEDGRLMVMHHGTPYGGFTVFKSASYFTQDKNYADKYQNPSASSLRGRYSEATNPTTYDVYLNIEKPFDTRNATEREIFDNEYYRKYGTGAPLAESGLPDWTDGMDLQDFIEEMEYDYDGLILDEGGVGGYGDGVTSRGLSYVVFDPSQVKNVSNKQPTSDPDIRFSMQDSVEETDKLLAVHNLTGEQLNGVLELGGFPMPSIAVLKATQGHDRYGDVSVVFDKATINPETNRLNKVYGGDAWTPNFPAVEYEVNSKAADKIQNKYYDLAKQKGYDFVRPMYAIANTLENELNRRGGTDAIIHELEDDTKMMNVFLEDSGTGAVEDVVSRKTTRLSNETMQEYDTIAAAVGKDAFSELYPQNSESPATVRKRWLSEHKESLVQGYTEFLKKFDFTDKQIQNVLDGESTRSLLDLAIKIRNYLKNGAETVTEDVDTSATEQAIREKTDTAKYKAWLHELLDNVEGKKGIYNGKERYTQSGNERSFSATHWEMTLENIVRAMRTDTKKGGGAFGDSGLFGLATKDYSSLDEIRADANRLRLENDSEYEAQKTAFSNEYQAIAQEIMDRSERNIFIAQDNAMEAIADAVRRGKTQAGIARVLNSYSSLNVREDTARRVYELVQGIANMPTEYFEAKPERAVGLDEIKAVVMPEGKYDEIREAMQERGVPVVDYNPEVEGDRVRALNEESMQELRFSRQDDGPVLDQRDVQRMTRTISQRDETIAALKQQLRLTHGLEVDEREYGKLAREILKKTGSTYDQTQLRNELRTMFQYGTEQENPNIGDIETYGTNLAMAVLENVSVVDKTLYNETKEMRDYLRNTPIKLTSTQMQEVKSAYDNYTNYRKGLSGRVKLDMKNGTSLDTVWQELVEKYPAFFSADTSEGDMAQALADVVDMVYDLTPENPYGYNIQTAAYDLFVDILSEYAGLEKIETFADKKAAELKQVRAQYQAKIKEMRAAAKQQYQERLRGEKTANAELLASLREKYKAAKERGDKTGMRDALNEYKKYSGEVGAALMKQRARYESQIADSKAKAKEREAVKKYRGRIEKTVSELTSWLVHPTDAKHVPEGMRNAVIGVLSSITFDKNTAKTKTANWQERMQKLRDAMMRASTGNADYSDYYLDVDPDFDSEVQEYMERNKGVQNIADMNSKQLKELSHVLAMVRHAVVESNTLRSNANFERVSDLANASRIDMNKRKTKKPQGKVVQALDQLFNFHQLDSFAFFKELGGASESVLTELRNGFDKKVQRLKEAKTYMNGVSKGIKLEELSGKNAQLYTFKTEEGKTIQLTKAQIMELYLLNKREQARGHIYGMGIRVNETTAKQGKKTVRTRMHSAAKMTVADVKNIVRTLSAQEIKLADAMGKFLGENVSEWGNETSLSMYGYKKFTEENYYPIKTDDNYTLTRDQNSENGGLWALKNLGMTKATKEGASNPLIIGDIFDTFARHVDEMSSYDGLVPALSDAMKWYNWKNEDGSIKQDIYRVMGQQGKTWFLNFIRDINGQGMGANYTSDLMSRLTSNAKAAAVGANLRVIIQQPTSYVRAAAMIDPKYLAAALFKKSNQEMAQKYSMIAQWKNWGFFDLHTGRSTRDIIVDDAPLSETIREKSMELAGMADDWTLGTLWNACEMEMRDTNPELVPGSEKFNKAVGERLSNVIDATQVVDSVFHRSQLMRSKNGATQMYTSFMSEPTKNYNLLRTAIMQAARTGKKADMQNAVRTTAAFVVSSIGTAAAASLVDAIRDDDDEKNYIEKYMASLGGNIADNLNPLGLVPILSDISEIIQGYSTSRMDMQGLEKLWNVGNQWWKFLNGNTKWSTERLIYQTTVALSTVTGVPVGNLFRDLTGLYNTLTPGDKLRISGNSPTEKESYANLFTAIKEGKKDKSQKLYDALLADALANAKKNDEKRVAEGKNPAYADEASYNVAARNTVEGNLATALANGDERIARAYEYREAGDTKNYEALYRELQNEGFSFNTIAKAINKYGNTFNKGETKTLEYEQESRYSADNLIAAAEKAVESGDLTDVLAIRDERMAASSAQDPMSSVRQTVSSTLMPRYVEAVRAGNTEEAERIGNVLVNAFAYEEKTLASNVTSDRNDDLRAAVKEFDTDGAKTYIQEARKAGKKDTDIASTINDVAKEQITTAALNNDYDTYQQWLNFLRGLGLKDSKGNYYSADRISGWVKDAKEKAREAAKKK